MEIKYVLWLQISLTDLDREVEFLFRMPVLFDSYKKAKMAEHDFYIKPALRFSGEVVFEVYKRTSAEGMESLDNPDEPIDTIQWEEYWKYESRIVKKDTAVENLLELLAIISPDNEISKLKLPTADVPCRKIFLPYADKFEVMYEKYLTKKKVEDICDTVVFPVSCEIRPLLL